MAKSAVDSWQPSAIQLERESWRRRQATRSTAIAAASTLLVLGVVGALALVWSSAAQLWAEARSGIAVLHTTDGTSYIPPTREQPRPTVDGDVIVISEKPAAD